MVCGVAQLTLTEFPLDPGQLAELLDMRSSISQPKEKEPLVESLQPEKVENLSRQIVPILVVVEGELFL